jgi:hypothetical protein
MRVDVELIGAEILREEEGASLLIPTPLLAISVHMEHVTTELWPPESYYLVPRTG